MPHFIIDCSATVLSVATETEILERIYSAAKASGLFTNNDIKVRLNPYREFITDGSRKDFIHVFGYIMEGRTTEQKAKLSRSIVSELTALFPAVEFIAMNVSEFEKATYCNRNLVENNP